ncbi:MAG: T9SS type A sorting domain-containing protein, partial [Chitinophagales bacterium]|nr:T9SS type A sorting domain-containing protein [Chitinophagales bacterium]
NSSLSNGSQVSCVLTSNAPCTSASSVSSISVQITVSSTVTPAISIVADTTTICQGGSVILTATPTNGGSSPTYQWRKNGTAINGATSANYTASNVANQDAFTCVLTSSVSCAAPTTATSNAVAITVNPSLTASVTLNYTTDSICNGESFIASAVSVNGGQNPSYQWQLNGTDITGQTGATYTSSALANNDQLRVKMISSAACAAPSPATSPALTITVAPVVVPSVTVSASQTTICTGTTVNFTATPVNGGANPVYVWQLNGNTISGATGATYSSSALSNNDSVSCQLVSAALCASPGTVSSSPVTISTTTSATASVTVTASDSTICNGEEVLFTALPIEGGSGPLYQWIKNAVDISGANAVTYTTNQLSNNDQLSCRMTSNSTCVTQPVVTSPVVGITVNVLPDVSITTAGNTLSVAEASTYQWLDCALNTAVSGATGQSFTPTATGNYAVLVVAGNGCSDTSACQSVTVTSITEPDTRTLKTWPVPAYNVLNVELLDGLTNISAEVYNALGQLTTVPFSQHGNQLQLTTTKLAAGLYVLQLKANGHTYTTRFVRAY